MVETRNLRSDDRFAFLRSRTLEICEGRSAIFVPNSGNWGDALINQGTFQFLRTIRLNARIVSRPQIAAGAIGDDDLRSRVLITPGCGAWCRNWSSARDFVQANHAKFAHVLVYPTTFELPAIESNAENITYFRRDTAESSLTVPNSHFCHDMAFFLRLRVHDPRQLVGVGNFFRTDQERNPLARVPERNIDLSAAGHEFSNSKMFFDIISAYRRIRTDRIHIAIAGAMIGREVELYAGNYWKAQALFESSLKPHYSNVSIKAWEEFAA
jgi:exopolysaccharide biosynthesis predicted pyruvyltransferase EpsI